MITVQNKVPIYEINGKESLNDIFFNVSSHWNSDKLVVLTLDSQTIVVKATDLIAAVNNSINNARF